MAEMLLTSKIVLWLALSSAFLLCKTEADLGETSPRLLRRHAAKGQRELAETLDKTKSEIEATLVASISRLQLALESRLDHLEAKMNEVLHELRQSRGRQTSTRPLIFSQSRTDLGSNTCELPANLASALNEFNSLIGQRKISLPEDIACGNVLDMISSIEALVRDMIVTLDNQWNDFTHGDSNCEEGWHYYEDSCYYFSYNEFNWTDGRQECIRKGGDYVKINNTEEWSYAASQLTGHSWVGLSDLEEEGRFKWISDGSDLGEMVDSWWQEGQPDNEMGQEHCVIYFMVDSHVTWNDLDCARRMRITCEKAPLGSSQ